MNIQKKDITEFIYNNLSSKDFFLKIKRDGVNIISDEIEIEEINIPASYKLHKITNQNTLKKIEIDAYIDVRDVGDTVLEIATGIKNWLQKEIKYGTLELSDDEELYYEAICFNKLDIKELLGKFGECKIVFTCRKTKAKSGDIPIKITNNYKIYNKHSKSYPLFKIKASGDIKININNNILDIRNVEDSIIIDNETMNVYKEINNTLINQNNKIYSNFITIDSGENYISYTGNVQELILIPRWQA
ncbi:MAG: hypothetical protein R3Y64_07690 [Peptostreptococcaceae bacterium]